MSAYDEAKRLLAYDPPTIMSGAEWRRLVEGLVSELEASESRADFAEQDLLDIIRIAAEPSIEDDFIRIIKLHGIIMRLEHEETYEKYNEMLERHKDVMATMPNYETRSRELIAAAIKAKP